MVVKVGDLEAVARVRDEFSQPLGKMGKGVQGLGTKFLAAGAVITAVGAKAGRDWDAAKTTIVQGTGATGDALDGLLGSFQNLSGTIAGADNDAVANAVADVNTAFRLTGPALEEVSTQVLQAKGAFGEFDIPQLGRSMKVFGLESDQAGRYLDFVGTVAQDTGVPIGKLLTQSQTFGPVMKNLGIGAEGTAAFFGKLHEAGVDVTRVMPGMNQAMRKAAKEGVTDLQGHIDGAMLKIREAKTDTEALTIATETFGAEGAQRMTAAIRGGILPTLSELDGQYENTEGRTKAAYEETVTLGDHVAMMKDRFLALVGPAGDVAAGIGGVATTAAVAGPNIVSMGGAIGTKLLPLLLGPAGLVLVLGALASAILLSRDNLDKFKISVGEFSTLTEAKMMQVITDVDERIRGLRKGMVLYGDVLGETSTEIAELEAKKRELIEALNDHREAAREVTVATEEETVAVGASAEAAVEAEEDWRAWTAEVEKLSAQMDLARRINEEMMSSLTGQSEVAIEDVIGQFGRLEPEAFDLIEPGLVAATEAAAEGIVSMAESFSDDIAAALLNGQDVSEALESAFKANAIPGIAKGAGNFIGGIVGKAAGPKIAGLIAGPIGGVLAGLAAGFLSKILGALGSAFSGGTAGKARDKGASKFRMSADGPQYYINGEWVDEDGNPVGGNVGEGGGSAGGEGSAQNPSSNATGGPVGAGEYSWVGERGPEVVRFGQAGNVTPNHALGPGPVQLVLRDGTVLAEVVAENMADVAARRGF